QVAQAQPDHFAQRMSDAGEFLEIDGGIDLNVAQRVEILHGDVELLGKELRSVRHDGGAAGKEEPLRGRTALLYAVKLHGLIDLDVQAGHELPGDLRDGRLVRVFRLFVSPPQPDGPFLAINLVPS